MHTQAEPITDDQERVQVQLDDLTEEGIESLRDLSGTPTAEVMVSDETELEERFFRADPQNPPVDPVSFAEEIAQQVQKRQGNWNNGGFIRVEMEFEAGITSKEEPNRKLVAHFHFLNTDGINLRLLQKSVWEI